MGHLARWSKYSAIHIFNENAYALSKESIVLDNINDSSVYSAASGDLHSRAGVLL